MSVTTKEFLLNLPLYEKVQIAYPGDLISFYTSFDGYNPIDRIETTFLIEGSITYEEDSFNSIRVKCKRTGRYFQFYIHWNFEEKTLEKVGQSPSVATFHTHEIKQYKNLLSPEKMKEFTKAMGLASHGVGIGSFVYLRRIFEYLIFEAYKECLAKGEVTEDEFMPVRMDDKINLLKNYLPSFLVEHRVIYSILSKGIHELDENTCLTHFDAIRTGIEIILDEHLRELEKQEKIQNASKKINAIKGTIANES